MGDLPFFLYQPGFVKGIKGVGQATEGKSPLGSAAQGAFQRTCVLLPERFHDVSVRVQ